jgi:hypothetical protein
VGAPEIALAKCNTLKFLSFKIVKFNLLSQILGALKYRKIINFEKLKFSISLEILWCMHAGAFLLW